MLCCYRDSMVLAVNGKKATLHFLPLRLPDHLMRMRQRVLLYLRYKHIPCSWPALRTLTYSRMFRFSHCFVVWLSKEIYSARLCENMTRHFLTRAFSWGESARFCFLTLPRPNALTDWREMIIGGRAFAVGNKGSSQYYDLALMFLD